MSIQNAWDAYWKNTKPGETQAFAGGSIQRQDDGSAMFTNAKGFQYGLKKDMSLDQVANWSPDIAKQWQQDFGYQRNADTNWFSQSSNGFDGNIVAKNPNFRDVNLNGAQSGVDAFNRIAGQKYGGILTLQDVSDIGDEVGGVGYYAPIGDGKYQVQGAYTPVAKPTGILGSATSGAANAAQSTQGQQASVAAPAVAAPAAPAPVGGAVSGGASAGGGVVAGQGGVASQAPAQQMGAAVNRQVDAGTETIEGRVQNLLATDARGNYTNPVVQQAVNATMQQFAGRGLLNSSMASEAAYQAAISKAIDIAGPDAQTYFAQGRANQDAANVFERDARGYEQDNLKMDKTIGFEREKMDKTIAADDRRLDKTIGFDREKLDRTIAADDQRLDKTIGFDREKLDQTIGFDREKLDKTIDFESGKLDRTIEADNLRHDKSIELDREKVDKSIAIEREKLIQSGSQFNQELQYKYEALRLDAKTRAEAEDRAHKNALEINNIKDVSAAYDLYLRRISDIDNNQEYETDVKVRMKNEAGKDFDLYSAAKGISYGMNLASRFAAAEAGDGKPPANQQSPNKWGRPNDSVISSGYNPDYGQG